MSFELDPGPVHGDAHLGNLIRREDDTVVLIDLEAFAWGPREWDASMFAAAYAAFNWMDRAEYRRCVDAIAWNLAGHEGNPRGPINREHFRVQAVRPDGSLEVAAITGRTPDGDALGDCLVLPASYVAEHLALGYASTVHAAQGGTVDTTHTVTTPRTAASALLVGLTRGQEANTAHVVTRSGVDDPARGGDRHELHRDPVAVLAGLLSDREPIGSRSATAIADESAEIAGSVQTAGERLADAAQLAATARTVRWLDQLTTDGLLSPDQRARIAAEDGAASLARVLRRAELAGHDPRQLLHDAITERLLTGATNTTNVLNSRITDGDTRRFDPIGTSWADWAPRTGVAPLEPPTDQAWGRGRNAAKNGAYGRF